MNRIATNPSGRGLNLRRSFALGQVLLAFGAVGAFAAVLLPPVENAPRETKQIAAVSPRIARSAKPSLRAQDEALDVDRSTAAEAPPHIRALHLETTEESATPEGQPGGVAGTCVTCPTGSTPENEPNCGLPTDTTNGGCNTPPTMPPQFSRIVCGQTYCGTAASDGATRDTDWYEVIVATSAEFTWTVFSGFPAAIGLVQMGIPGSGLCADAQALNPFALVSACTSASVTVCLPPGKHWFFVAPQFANPVTCGTQYTARLTCTTCPEGACCADGCFITDRETCNSAGGPYLGDGTNCEDPAICLPVGPCAECGPGPHWIHNPPCPPGGIGQDTIPSGAVAGIDLNGDCIADTNLILGGPVTIGKKGPLDDSGQYPGLRAVNGHLDVIDTEMLAMTLTGGGATLIAGGGLGAMPLRPSTGAIAEDPANPNLADSFFDVFFEIEYGAGLYAYNRTPVRVATTIDCLPPDGIYAHIVGCLPLYRTPTGSDNDVPVAHFVSANHFTYPGCCLGDECREAPTQDCEQAGGIVVPDCFGDSDGNETDDACEKQACCLPNGQCLETIPSRCNDAGGVPKGLGSACAGDGDGDGIDDVCPARPCEECGPGPHWIHNPLCPPGGTGSDTIPSGAYAGVDVTGDCIADTNLVLFGPATIHKRGPADDSAYFPGLRPVDAHLDVVNTELVAMSLTGGGVVLTAGSGLGAIPLPPSYGAVAEQPGNPALADSFFDVFFEVDTPSGRLYNQTPIRVETTVTCLPPDGIYKHITDCLPLYTSPRPGQGEHVANLTSANHFTYPGCCFGTTCVEPAPSYCEAENGTLVPDCLGDGNGNEIDDACEQGACCLPQTCDPPPPSMCEGGFPNCHDNLDCHCFEVAEDGGNCSLDFSCANTQCPNGTIDCPPGQNCKVNTCCVVPTCGPMSCEAPPTAAPVDQAVEPTAAGGQGGVSGEIIVPTPVCVVTNRRDCEELGGVYEGDKTVCTPTTCVPLEACCLPQGRCELLLPERCREAHGVPMGPESQCKGDNNGNKIDDACEPAKEPCTDCGPGAHWMHNPPCPPGADIISTGAVVGVSINDDCIEDTNLVLFGNAAVLRSGPRDDSANYPGLRPVDGHRDVIDTEMVAMSLTGSGFTLVAGAGLGQGGVLPPSLGAIAELAGDPALADSFFDVFFEIRPDGGSPVYNQNPVRVRSQINCLPPDATYFHLIECLPLYTSPIPGQGALVAYLTSANHSTFPECGDPGTGSCYVPHDPPFCDDEKCCKMVCDEVPDCCEQGWKPICAEVAKRICAQPTVVKWESVLTHARPGVEVGPVGLEIPDDGSFSESRNAIRKIVVTFTLPIDPASATKENVNICGLKPCDVPCVEPGTYVPVDLSGVAITVKTSDGDTKLVINFEPGLPDFARYRITLKGIHGQFGPLKPGDGGLSRILTALRGDARMDLRVNATDVGGARFLVGTTDPIDPAIEIEVRCDINLDARVNATDVGGIRFLTGRDARAIPNPDCPLCGDGVVDSPEECENDAHCPAGLSCRDCKCVRNPECTGAACGTFTPCNPTSGCTDPVCATTDHGGVCLEGATGCAGLPPCTTSADCTAPGALCAVQTCCGGGVCLEPSTFCEPAVNECFKDAVCSFEFHCTNDVCNCFFTAAGNTRCFADNLPLCPGAPCATDADCAAGEACSNTCCGLTCAPLCGGSAAAAPVKDYSAGSISGNIPPARAPVPVNVNPARSGNIE